MIVYIINIIAIWEHKTIYTRQKDKISYIFILNYIVLHRTFTFI